MNLKFKLQKVQCLSSNLALESHQNSAPLNCDKFFKSIATSPFFFSRQNCTLIVFDLSFFLYFEFWFIFFYLFSNTSIYSDPEFQNLSPTKLIFINNFSQHWFSETEETYYGIKNNIEKLQRHIGMDVYELVWI